MLVFDSSICITTSNTFITPPENLSQERREEGGERRGKKRTRRRGRRGRTD
jgi:hypothetical protein